MAARRGTVPSRRRGAALWLLAGALALGAALAARPVAAAPPEVPPDTAPAATAPKIDALVQNLGDADYQTREAAEKQLRALGAPALEALTAAMASNDAEVRERATRLALAIRRNRTRHDALWQVQLAAAASAPPATGSGRVYLGTRDGQLHAFDARTGAEQWTAEVGTNVAAAPVVAGDAVYAVTADGRVLACDAARGTLRWSFREFGGLSAPVADKSLVWVSGSGDLYALDVTTGKVQWQAKIEGRAIGAPAVGADEVYVALSDGKVVALAQSDGKQRWQAETGHSLTTGPTVADGVLFLGTNEGLLALDLATRQSKWECAIPGANADAGAMNGPGIVFVNPPGGIAPGRAPVRGEAAPLVVGGTVYAGAGDKLYAFEAGNGAARWTLSPLPPDRAPGAGPPAGPAGVPPGVLRIQGGGQLIIRGNVRFINQLNDGAARAPAAAAADGLALLASADGLFAAASRDGLQMWCYPTPAPADAPVVAGGVIYFTCGPGNGLAPGFRNGPPGPGAAPWALFALPIQAAGK